MSKNSDSSLFNLAAKTKAAITVCFIDLLNKKEAPISGRLFWKQWNYFLALALSWRMLA